MAVAAAEVFEPTYSQVRVGVESDLSLATACRTMPED
jgi:hypothetical protein